MSSTSPDDGTRMVGRIARLTTILALSILSATPALSEDVERKVDGGIDAVALAAAGPKPFVDIVCPLMQQEAASMKLPPMFFVRLIWKESRFNPSAVSPKGAQGIAQFMPKTADDGD